MPLGQKETKKRIDKREKGKGSSSTSWNSSNILLLGVALS